MTTTFGSPITQSSARIGWHLFQSNIIYSEPPYLVMQALPEFPGSRPDPEGATSIVWNILDLCDSVRRPGGYQLLDAGCGYAPDVFITENVYVSHPDADTVIWELDLKGLWPALAGHCEGDSGFVRLVFERQQYEADIRKLLNEIQEPLRGAVPLKAVRESLVGESRDGLDQATLFQVEWEPHSDGEEEERLLRIDAAAPWPREPLWPPGTLVEFGFFPFLDGHEFIRVDGQLIHGWAATFFTRWIARDAMRTWLSPIQRGWCLPKEKYRRSPDEEKNRLFLLREQDRMQCHADGHRLAAVMQACLDENLTAQGVTVRYEECAIAVAEQA